jgi:hypothetical protein
LGRKGLSSLKGIKQITWNAQLQACSKNPFFGCLIYLELRSYRLCCGRSEYSGNYLEFLDIIENFWLDLLFIKLELKSKLVFVN